MRVKPYEAVTVWRVARFRFRRRETTPELVEPSAVQSAQTASVEQAAAGRAESSATPADVLAAIDPDACFVLVALLTVEQDGLADVFTLEADGLRAHVIGRGVPASAASALIPGPISVVTVRSADPALMDALTAAGRACSRVIAPIGDVTALAVSELATRGEGRRRLGEAMRAAVDEHCADLDMAVTALRAGANVLTVDTLTGHDVHRCAVDDIYVLDDLRLLRTRRVGTSHPGRLGQLIDTKADAADLGRVTEVRFMGESVELVTSQQVETAVTFEGAVTGYRYVPLVLKVPEFVAASILVTLAEAGSKVTIRYA